MNKKLIKDIYNRKFLNIFIIFSSFIASLPSLLIYFSDLLTRNSTEFTRNSVLFNEKFWIYLLEFKRNSINGFLNWPSGNIEFSNIIYFERLIPRLIYYPIRNNINLYFIYDAIIIFAVMIICQFLIIKILSIENIKKISIPIVLGVLSIYNLRIIFLEEGIFESWFSRNPVAIISLTFFISIYLSNRYLIHKKNCILYTIIFILFSLIHTYSYFLAVTYYLLMNFSQLFINKKNFEINKIFLPIPSLIIFIIYYLSLNNSESFIVFRDYYGLVKSYTPNINELLKILFLFLITFLFVPKTTRLNFSILIITSIALTNTHIFTGNALRDIHYRIYSIEWLCSFYIISYLIKNIYSFFNEKIINYAFLGIFLIYSFSYIKDFKYSNLIIDSNKNCSLSTPMTGAILDMNKEESLNCNIFIWDAPSVEDTRRLFKQSKDSDLISGGWMQGTVHLHPKLLFEK